MKKKESPVIDYVTFGALLRACRIASGYKSGQDLLDKVKEKTGFEMDLRSLYRIERGERGMTLEAYLAFQQVMPSMFNAKMFAPAFKFSPEYEEYRFDEARDD